MCVRTDVLSAIQVLKSARDNVRQETSQAKSIVRVTSKCERKSVLDEHLAARRVEMIETTAGLGVCAYVDTGRGGTRTVTSRVPSCHGSRLGVCLVKTETGTNKQGCK